MAEGQKADFSAIGAASGKWRVADGQLIPRFRGINFEFRPKAMEITDNGATLKIPEVPTIGFKECLLKKQ